MENQSHFALDLLPIRRALISVADKTGIVTLARGLYDCGVELITTDGTSRLLQQENITHREVSEFTQAPAILDGRIKTLHPKIAGAILGRRDVHADEAKQLNIEWIDLVIVNFYPFADAIATHPQLSWPEICEYVDIGGPTLVRAAAKNSAWVAVVVEIAYYARILAELTAHGGLTQSLRWQLAQTAFAVTSNYDSTISNYLQQRIAPAQAIPEVVAPSQLKLTYNKYADLRYGENPHQQAWAYQESGAVEGIFALHQYQGKPLSYNNLLDSDAALNALAEFVLPACVIIKHGNPCGAALGSTIEAAYTKAYQADSRSAFGGIVALNQICDHELAQKMSEVFLEVILAPSYTNQALEIFRTKPQLRILEFAAANNLRAQSTNLEKRYLRGGMLVQESNYAPVNPADWAVVTVTAPCESDWAEMQFGWQVLKHVKSNGIVISANLATAGIGAGQVARIDAVEQAMRKAKSRALTQAILASDAFFPFRDSIDTIASANLVRIIVQPGGSLRDAEVIAACNQYKIAMVFTGVRCFKH